MMRFILIIILNFFILLSFFAQIDTLQFDVSKMAMNFQKSKKVLFGNFQSLSYPTQNLWTASDSAFVYNKDTIYIEVFKRKQLKVEGLKLPERQAFGEVKFYNSNQKLHKTEFWVETFTTDYNGVVYSSSDEPVWINQTFFLPNGVVKEISKSIIYDEKKGSGIQVKRTKFKNGHIMRTKIDKYYF